jgi:hypothetical protein
LHEGVEFFTGWIGAPDACLDDYEEDLSRSAFKA